MMNQHLPHNEFVNLAYYEPLDTPSFFITLLFLIAINGAYLNKSDLNLSSHIELNLYIGLNKKLNPIPHFTRYNNQ